MEAPQQQQQPQAVPEAVAQAQEVNGEEPARPERTSTGWDVRPPGDQGAPAEAAGPTDQQPPVGAQGEGQGQDPGGSGEGHLCMGGARHPRTVFALLSHCARTLIR